MGSSSGRREGSDEETNKIKEDPVLLWWKEHVAYNPTFRTLFQTDREHQKLVDLIKRVYEGKDVNATRQNLSELLGTDKARKPVGIRARVLTTLIAIALGLKLADIVDRETGKESVDFQTALRSRLADITVDSETGKESVDFQTALRSRLADALKLDNSVLSYLFKDALEADDEVMTVIFCDSQFFEKYPVQYFNGCDLAVVQEISKLWLSQEFLRRFYYCTVVEQVVNQVEAEQVEVKISVETTMLLYDLLRKRTVKAGARLLEVMLSFRNDTTDRVRELVKGLVFPLVRFKTGTRKGKFRGHFFEHFQNRSQLIGSDQERGHLGQSITVGPSFAQTDSNLLCWAARRGYYNLIWCISLGYAKVYEMRADESLLDDVAEMHKISLLWKVALWCATRHGQYSVVMQLTSHLWVKRIDFNDYTEIRGCLPPLHLVSLLGDRDLLHCLCVGKVGIQSGAHKMDYLGKTPLDYAMRFQLITRNSKEEEQYHIPTDYIERRKQSQDPSNELKNQTQAPVKAKCWSFWLQQYTRLSMATPGHRSCIQELLQMPSVVDRLKELNDMYTTQANFVLVGAALIASVAFVGWLQPPLSYADYFQFTQPSPPAPTGTYEQYVAVEGHLSVQMFVVFNALSFFLGIGTMLIGVGATLFVHDNDERTIALMKVRISIKWMLGFFIASMVCIMAAFICAGLAILPPIQRLEWSMVVSLCLGACICLMPLSWILGHLIEDQTGKLIQLVVKLIQLVVKPIQSVVKPILPGEKLIEREDKDKEKTSDDSLNSLVDEEDEKTFKDEKNKDRGKEPSSENQDSPKPSRSASPHSGSLDDGPLEYGRTPMSMLMRNAPLRDCKELEATYRTLGSRVDLMLQQHTPVYKYY